MFCWQVKHRKNVAISFATILFDQSNQLYSFSFMFSDLWEIVFFNSKILIEKLAILLWHQISNLQINWIKFLLVFYSNQSWFALIQWWRTKVPVFLLYILQTPSISLPTSTDRQTSQKSTLNLYFEELWWLMKSIKPLTRY